MVRERGVWPSPVAMRLFFKRHHYVCAAITALFECIPLIYSAIGLIFLLTPRPTPAREQFDARYFGLIFALIGAAFALCGWEIAACIFAAGRSIKARKRRLFCIVVSAINRAFFPLGTALGVLSILVLSRPTVKEMFDRQPARDAAPQADPRPGVWYEIFDDIHNHKRNHSNLLLNFCKISKDSY